MKSLLFLTYNRLGIVARCFRSLAYTLHTDVEWCIVDNASTDGTSEWVLKLAKQYPNIRLELSAKNLGVSGGRARLLEMAQGETLLFLDTDVEARRPDWLDKLLAPLANPKVGISGIAGHWLTPNWLWYEPVPDGFTGSVDVVSGYCQAFRRDLINAGAKLDLDFGRYWHEDSDFCLQARSLGYDVWCAGEVGLHHMYSGTGDTGDGHTKQAYLASKWKGKGLVKHETAHSAIA